ncbi:MAG: hypothetical protein V4496_04805 [Pseudomonadota bacterium]
MPRTQKDIINIQLFEKIMRDMHSQYPEPPSNRGITFAFLVLLREAMGRFGETKPSAENISFKDGFSHIAQHVELSEYFFNEKNYSALAIAILKVAQSLIEEEERYKLGKISIRSTSLGCIQDDLNDLRYWHTGVCRNYASIAMYALLEHKFVAKQYCDFVRLSPEPETSENKDTTGHAIIIINQEPVDYLGNNYLLSPNAIVFDFWQGRVYLVSEYDFSPFPWAKLKFRAHNSSKNPLKLFDFDSESSNRAFFDSCNKSVNAFLRTINQRKENNEAIMPADYARFCEIAKNSFAEFDPDDLLDEKRVNATVAPGKNNIMLGQALNIHGSFSSKQTSDCSITAQDTDLSAPLARQKGQIF